MLMPATKPQTIKALTEYQRKVLAEVHEDGGFLTRRVAERVRPMFGSNMRQHSAAVRVWLLQLKSLGLVAFLDDQKPVCWKRTPAGTEALEQC